MNTHENDGILILSHILTHSISTSSLLLPSLLTSHLLTSQCQPIYRPAIGRFAPSPTGELHLGSLTTAIASYCHIKSFGGLWLLRIEDTDTDRCHQQFSDQILIDLERLGLHWDGQVIYQSERTDIYNELLHTKLANRVYGCTCTRKQLAGYDIYPRLCLDKPSTDQHSDDPIAQHTSQKENPTTQEKPFKTRIQLPDYAIGFVDQLQGVQWVNPQQTLGDVVLKRADGIINYFLAASVDDGLQGITHIMRGLDILPLTTAQIAIMHYLNLPTVEHWYHLPLVENKQGQKLSKQNLATPIDTSSTQKCQSLIHQALALLKQPPVDTQSPIEMLAQATSQWQNTPLTNQKVLGKA